MYSAVHGAIGVAVVGVTYLFTQNEVIAMTVGSILAFLAHDPTDRLGEKGYGNIKSTLFYEIPPYLIMLLGGWLSGFFWLFLIGYIAGNGIDLIDKKMYLSVFNPKKYPVTYHFKCHRRKPNFQLTLKQTKLAAYLSCILIIAIALLINY